ncbi:MAG TPA: DUF4082 domain-containing protein, partial [Haliangiales bacterium]|nr:DUF4082 domain-containing protein [Haliangiales bacterium]
MKDSLLAFWNRARAPILCGVGAALLIGHSGAGVAAEPDRISDSAWRQIRALQKEKLTRSAAHRKLDSQFVFQLQQNRNQLVPEERVKLRTDIKREADGRVLVDMDANITAAGITLTNVLPPSVTFQAAAVSQGDDVSTRGTLVFTPGQTSKTVTATVFGDLKVESNETFQVNLFGVSSARIAGATGMGMIVKQDGLPGQVDHFAWGPIPSPQLLGQPFPVTITAQDYSNGTASNFNGTVTLSGAAGGGITNSILGDLTHLSSAFGTWTLGYAFTPNTDILLTHVRHYFGSKVSIWTDDGTLLASQNVSSTPGTWVETPLATPVPLAAGNRYRV